MKEIIGDYDAVVANINRGLAEAGIERDEIAILDHLCFRTETLEEYYQSLERFAVLGRNMGEVAVQGRPISAIALDDPLRTGGWIIPYLEVAAPKAGSPYPSGLEHAEMVPIKTLSDFEAQHAELPFIRDALDPATRPINPELKLRDFGMSVKFHPLTIGAAIEIEERLGLTES